MASPITLYDARGNRLAFTSSNQLIPASNQNSDRKPVPLLDRDLHRSISAQGRRTLLSIGRRVYWECHEIRGAIEESAEIASCVFLPDYRGSSAEFKLIAEEQLYQHDRWIDIAGPPNTMRSYRKGLLRLCLVDGDVGTVLVEQDGLPYIQVIPSHRIASGRSDLVMEGRWKGRQIVDGVIVDGQLAPLAYRILLGDSWDFSKFIDVDARSMFLRFAPLFPGQLRGISALGVVGWDVQDKRESKSWELLAQKAGAGLVFQEYNETGEAPITSDWASGPSAGATTSGTPSGLWRQTIDGGMTRYFPQDSNGRIEAVKFDRPSSNQQEFSAQVSREYFAGAGLSIDFHLDLSKLGGAPLRVLVEKVNRVSQEQQQCVIEPSVRRVDAHRIPIFMRNGQIPTVDDWHLIEYQGPPQLTADKKYDADVDAQEVRTGIKTRTSSAARRGETLKDIRDIKEQEVRDLFLRAQKLAAEFGIPLALALTKLEEDSLNGQIQIPTEEPAEDGEGGDLSESDQIKATVDAYGVAVRAGAITPTIEDEKHFRTKFGYAPLSAQAEAAWGKEDNVRRPITLTPLPGQEPAAFPGRPAPASEEDEE